MMAVVGSAAIGDLPDGSAVGAIVLVTRSILLNANYSVNVQ